MKFVGWSSLFLVSFLAGHFAANPWLLPVGNILLFLQLYIGVLLGFILLAQVCPYAFRQWSVWHEAIRSQDGFGEESFAGPMRFSLAAAGGSLTPESGREEGIQTQSPLPSAEKAEREPAEQQAGETSQAEVPMAEPWESDTAWMRDPEFMAAIRGLILLPPGLEQAAETPAAVEAAVPVPVPAAEPEESPATREEPVAAARTGPDDAVSEEAADDTGYGEETAFWLDDLEFKTAIRGLTPSLSGEGQAAAPPEAEETGEAAESESKEPKVFWMDDAEFMEAIRGLLALLPVDGQVEGTLPGPSEEAADTEIAEDGQLPTMEETEEPVAEAQAVIAAVHDQTRLSTETLTGMLADDATGIVLDTEEPEEVARTRPPTDFLPVRDGYGEGMPEEALTEEGADIAGLVHIEPLGRPVVQAVAATIGDGFAKADVAAAAETGAEEVSQEPVVERIAPAAPVESAAAGEDVVLAEGERADAGELVYEAAEEGTTAAILAAVAREPVAAQAAVAEYVTEAALAAAVSRGLGVCHTAAEAAGPAVSPLEAARAEAACEPLAAYVMAEVAAAPVTAESAVREYIDGPAEPVGEKRERGHAAHTLIFVARPELAGEEGTTAAILAAVGREPVAAQAAVAEYVTEAALAAAVSRGLGVCHTAAEAAGPAVSPLEAARAEAACEPLAAYVMAEVAAAPVTAESAVREYVDGPAEPVGEKRERSHAAHTLIFVARPEAAAEEGTTAAILAAVGREPVAAQAAVAEYVTEAALAAAVSRGLGVCHTAAEAAGPAVSPLEAARAEAACEPLAAYVMAEVAAAPVTAESAVREYVDGPAEPVGEKRERSHAAHTLIFVARPEAAVLLADPVPDADMEMAAADPAVLGIAAVHAEAAMPKIMDVAEVQPPMECRTQAGTVRQPYSCRLRCSRAEGIASGPLLTLYCRFVCRKGND